MKEDLESLAKTLSVETDSRIIGRKPTTYKNRRTSNADLAILFDENFRLGLPHGHGSELFALDNSVSEIERYLRIVKAVQDFRERYKDYISDFDYIHAKIEGHFCQECEDANGRVLEFVFKNGKRICIGYAGNHDYDYGHQIGLFLDNIGDKPESW